MVERAKELFERIAREHGLRLVWDDQSPVEAAATLPKQPGLDFDIWLNLQNAGELGIQTRLFSASWFPSGDPENEAAFLTAASGLISGEVRLVCSYGPFSTRPYRVVLQRRTESGWERIYSYRRLCVLIWPSKETVIVNSGSR
jgi:hypothetical protein